MSEKFTQNDLAQRATDRQAKLNAIYGNAAPEVSTGGLTDLELRNSPVPVSTGDNPLTDIELRDAPVPITLGAEIPSVTLSSGKTLETASISVSSSGNNTIVAAVPAQRIKVTAFSIQATGTVNVKFRDGSTDITGPYNFQAREGLAMGTAAPEFVFATTAGNALVLNLSSGVSVVGFVTYFTNDAT